jgi:hypothetical protein
MNPLRAVLILLADLVLAATFKFKMAAKEIDYCILIRATYDLIGGHFKIKNGFQYRVRHYY